MEKEMETTIKGLGTLYPNNGEPNGKEHGT